MCVAMKQIVSDPEDARLRALLRESVPAPALPSRFHESVWRRIERAETEKTAESVGWTGTLVKWALRPKFAFAGLTVLILAGAILGVQQGTQGARRDAQTRYLAAVAPNPVR